VHSFGIPVWETGWSVAIFEYSNGIRSLAWQKYREDAGEERANYGRAPFACLSADRINLFSLLLKGAHAY
jgi:hypothetical protein